jgi:hypothetical protein
MNILRLSFRRVFEVIRIAERRSWLCVPLMSAYSEKTLSEVQQQGHHSKNNMRKNR